MSNKKLLKGAFILAFAGLAAKFLGVFFKIPLQKLIGDEGMGLFGLPYPLYTVMLSISITGFPAAVSKLISEKLASEDVYGANKIFTVSLIMLISIGLFSSAFLYFGAHYIIDLLDWPRDAYYSIVGLSIAPLFVSIMSAFRGYFQGMQLMGPTAISQIVEQIGRVLIGVGLSYYTISMGVGYAAGAASFGASAGSILGVIVLVICYFIFKKSYRIDKKEKNYTRVSSWSIVKQITWFAIPISIGGILSSIMTLIDAIMVPSRLLRGGYTVEGITVLYGQLTGKAVTLMNVPLTFSVAMAASIIPAIAESYSRRNLDELREKTKSALKITIIIALPAAIGLSILAPQIIHLLWGKGEAGGEILRVLSLNVIFISLAQILGSILQGTNKVYTPLRNLLIGVIIKIIVSYYLLVSKINILGAVVGSIIGYLVVMVLNYIEVKRSIKFKIGIKNSILKPVVASAFMVITICFIYPYIYLKFLSENIATLISIMMAMLVYFLIIYFSRAIDLSENMIIKK
ncbi:putative polysaccharide biosynthesis protein [Alkaliphilus sp. B6464]|uniref:putative polysaccharide biosynthesis protein n=1 Tax=Alkaliphilus sp. B6464 TaxID=2731219 RepID=UPI001BA716FB|nr:polysaccharide biosynthesis protein [Alkaliphilus sp. B6464]QUH20163.1 polysaccharide biosynthesis protein [Alkaliphilus sp. B6464]